MISGSKVLIVCGQHQHNGEFGTYLYHSYDSGYYVPFIELSGGIVIRPWDREVICKDDLMQKRKDHLHELTLIDQQIEYWNTKE